MQEIWGTDFASKTLITGDSAGIVLVIGIALQYSPDFLGQLYYNTGNANPWGLFDKDPMRALDEHTLQRLIKGNEDTYKKLNQKIKIGGSTFPATHYWKDSWSSDKELLQTMRNSLYVPFISHRRYHTPYEGREVVDGAFCLTGKDLVDGDLTLYIGTNKGADIYTELTWKQKTFPNRKHDYIELEERGYKSFMTWVAGGGVVKKKVGVKQANLMIQCLLWSLKGLESFLFKGVFASCFGKS